MLFALFLSSLNARVQTEEAVKPSANDHVSRNRHVACDIYVFLAPAAQRASTHSSHAMVGISNAIFRLLLVRIPRMLSKTGSRT